jgi:hypothetical protein
MPEMDKRLKRIRALLDRAQRVDTAPEEAEAARQKAMRLMVEHGIDQAMIDAVSGANAAETINSLTITMHRPYTFEKGELLSAIAWVFGCDSSASRYPGRHAIESVTLYGYRSDMERAQLLYTSLVMQATNEMAAVREPFGVPRVTFLRDFLYGFSLAVTNRLREYQQAATEKYEAQHRAESAATGSENAPVSVLPVLADRRERVKTFFESQTEGLPTATPVERDGVGMYVGHVAGQRADLGHGPRVSTGPAAQDTLTLVAAEPVIPAWITGDHWQVLADVAMSGSQPCAAQMGATPAFHLEVMRAVVGYCRSHGAEHTAWGPLVGAARERARAVVAGDPGKINELAFAVLSEVHDRIDLWMSRRAG